MAIANRVAVMSDGRVVQSGTPEELYRNPNSPFVAGFVGSAMHLEGQSNGAELNLVGGTLKLRRDGDGQQVFVRAEDVMIDPSGPLTGQVAAITFLCTHYRDALNGITPGTLTATCPGQNPPKMGDRVNV